MSAEARRQGGTVDASTRPSYSLSMTSAAAKVLEQALRLTPEERIELARELEASVDPQAESPEWVAAWKAELERRRDEPTAPASQVHERLLARFPERE